MMHTVYSHAADAPPVEICWQGHYTAPWRDDRVLATLPQTAWNGAVVRLAVFEPCPSPRMVLQTACYFDYIGTNLSSQPCERTDAIGISALLLTADGSCILQRRRPDLAIRPGMLGPSMSGTLEPSDLDGVRWLHQLTPHREICEELGVSVSEIAHCRLLGLARDPERNGAPELLYHGQLHLTAAELHTRPHPEGEVLVVAREHIPTLPNQAPTIHTLLQMLHAVR